jgi:phospholipase D-like protein
MTPVATSTFLQVIFAMMIMVPMVILWVAAVVDVFRHGYSGLKVAAMLVLILIVPILGPILYFVFRKPEVDAEGAYMAEAELRRQAAQRPVGGSGMYR